MEEKQVWRKELSDTEKVEYAFSLGERYKKVSLICWGIVSVPLLLLLGLGLFTFAFAFVYYRYYLPAAHAYAFTNKRVLIRRGWLSVRTISIDYERITDLQVMEPFFEKILFHCGSIAINTAGSNGNEVVLVHIQDPYEVKKQLNMIRESNRSN